MQPNTNFLIKIKTPIMHHFYKNLSSSLPIKKWGDKMGWTGMFNLPFFAGWAKKLKLVILSWFVPLNSLKK
jgi:hypothetical protein